VGNKRRILQRKYWALVIGSPRRPKGLISAPLGKVRMSLMLNTINQKPLVFFNIILKIFVLWLLVGGCGQWKIWSNNSGWEFTKLVFSACSYTVQSNWIISWLARNFSVTSITCEFFNNTCLVLYQYSLMM